MNIYKPTHKAKSERGAKVIAKRNPWHVSYKAIIDDGAVVDDGKGNYWIYTIDHVINGVWGTDWHKFEPTGRIDKLTGEPEPIVIDMYT